MVDNTYLAHYGVKGMRWGVRRYQNRDGSLTDAGRKRYGRYGSDVSSVARAHATAKSLDTQTNLRNLGRGVASLKSAGARLVTPSIIADKGTWGLMPITKHGRKQAIRFNNVKAQNAKAQLAYYQSYDATIKAVDAYESTRKVKVRELKTATKAAKQAAKQASRRLSDAYEDKDGAEAAYAVTSWAYSNGKKNVSKADVAETKRDLDYYTKRYSSASEANDRAQNDWKQAKAAYKAAKRA